MGQKVNPTGFRVGITEDWKSKWYAPKAAFGDFLGEDFRLRKLIDAKLNRRPPFAAVSDILIERKVAPIKVIEIKNPELNAQLVAEAIAEQLKKRASFRRVMKMRMDATMQAGAKGIKIQVSGRLGGAEIARQEKSGQGSVPLTTLQANVDYGYAIAFTTYGTIGVKTWIYRRMYGDENMVSETDVRPGGPPRRGRR